MGARCVLSGGARACSFCCACAGACFFAGRCACALLFVAVGARRRFVESLPWPQKQRTRAPAATKSISPHPQQKAPIAKTANTGKGSCALFLCCSYTFTHELAARRPAAPSKKAPTTNNIGEFRILLIDRLSGPQCYLRKKNGFSRSVINHSTHSADTTSSFEGYNPTPDAQNLNPKP